MNTKPFPDRRPSEPTLWVYLQDDAILGKVLLPNGFCTQPVQAQSQAQRLVNALLQTNYLNEVQAATLRDAIAASRLKAPVPNNWRVCNKCWIPIAHGHLTFNDEEVETRFSIRGAFVALASLVDKEHLPDEEAHRIKDEITSCGLPDTSDIDVLLMAQEELERRQNEALQSSLTNALGTLFSGLYRHGQIGNQPLGKPMKD